MILLLIILLLVFGLPGGWYGYNNWGRGPGIGIILLVLLVVLLLGYGGGCPYPVYFHR
jgi:hypothetical protein